MAKTACRDCKNCTNSSFANAGRKAGRWSAGLMTVGVSEVAMATKKKCRACGHQMSLHGVDQVGGAVQPTVQTQPSSIPVQPQYIAPAPAPAPAFSAPAPTPVPSAAPAPPPPPPAVPAGWYPDPQGAPLQRYWDGQQWTEHTAPTVSGT